MESSDLSKYIELYKDFMHPNPHINSQAVFILRGKFRSRFLGDLLLNLEDKDVFLRRKSILELGRFGEEVFKPIIQLYLKTDSNIVKASCLKTIIKVIVNFDLKELKPDVMLVLDIAIKDDSPQIILLVTSVLRQLGLNGKDALMKTCRDQNLLRAKASITALLEINDPSIDDFLKKLLKEKSIDPIIKEDISRHKDIS